MAPQSIAGAEVDNRRADEKEVVVVEQGEDSDDEPVPMLPAKPPKRKINASQVKARKAVTKPTSGDGQRAKQRAPVRRGRQLPALRGGAEVRDEGDEGSERGQVEKEPDSDDDRDSSAGHDEAVDGRVARLVKASGAGGKRKQAVKRRAQEPIVSEMEDADDIEHVLVDDDVMEADPDEEFIGSAAADKARERRRFDYEIQKLRESFQEQVKTRRTSAEGSLLASDIVWTHKVRGWGFRVIYKDGIAFVQIGTFKRDPLTGVYKAVRVASGSGWYAANTYVEGTSEWAVGDGQVAALFIGSVFEKPFFKALKQAEAKHKAYQEHIKEQQALRNAHFGGGFSRANGNFA